MKLAVIVLVVAATISRIGLATAQSAELKYKWPYRSTTSAAITTLPFQQEHGCFGIPATNPRPPYECVAAYDLVIADRNVVSSHQGTVAVADNTITTCRGDGGLGTQVWIDNIKYGHLASIASSVSFGTVMLQGDAAGVQGNTGNTLPPTCGEHLRWEFGGITYGSPIPVVNGGSSASTNSLIGEFSTAGATERAYYQANGGWNTIGWTVDLGNGLNVFGNRSWGRIQDFRHDPDGFGGQNNTIHVANWNQTQVYLVDSVFWAAWAGGGPAKDGIIRPISMALQDRGACPAGSTAACLSYQRFHLGYVWMDVFTGRQALFCPDVVPPYNAVTITDATYVVQFVGSTTTPYADIDGNGAVAIFDAIIVVNNIGLLCYPR